MVVTAAAEALEAVVVVVAAVASFVLDQADAVAACQQER